LFEIDYENPDNEKTWVLAQRKIVENYLKRERLTHGQIGEWSAWHVAPCTSVWAIESLKSPGSVGWWVVSGDHPTDYISSSEASHPREVLLEIGKRWGDAAKAMSGGRKLFGITIGAKKDAGVLAPLLSARSKLFLEIAADEDSWDYDDAGFED
jgi:Domain of unknown function (DUF4826)